LVSLGRFEEAEALALQGKSAVVPEKPQYLGDFGWLLLTIYWKKNCPEEAIRISSI